MLRLLFILFIFQNFLFSDTTIIAFNGVHQSFGGFGNNRVVLDTIQFPISNADYSEIIMTVDLDCPDGGCDPWDRKAKISVMHLNNWYEIGRYVTPYGIECGWSFDVTDYRSLLRGEVPLRSFIDTWVQPGWLVTITFDFISGIPQHRFSIVRNIWNYDYIIYGDGTNPVDIPPVTEYIPNDAQNVYLRMITTGHGQGNTDNAAEFSMKFHDIFLNGSIIYEHDFWRDDCEFNQCSPQNGTWLYDRAGFCPGDKVLHQDFNILDYTTVGDTVRLEYVLEDYFNECSPNNPFCVNGVTCSICDYNNSGHTEPNYFIGSHLIIRTESYHSNADTYFTISSDHQENDLINIYLENYVPVYGIQFKLDLNQIIGIEISNLSFEDGMSGRAEEFGWTMAIGEADLDIGLLVIGLAQGTGEPILPGEGLLTQIPWNGSNYPELAGSMIISDLEVSGYFGSELSSEIGPPLYLNPGLIIDSPILPNKHRLFSAFPNPFNSNVNITFELSSKDNISINIFDLNGKQVYTLIDQSMEKGKYNLGWSADAYPSGIYLYTLESASYIETKKMILLK